jgi:hypothetical protein
MHGPAPPREAPSALGRLHPGRHLATVQPMSRTLAALLLVAFAWSQAFAADCPLAAPAAGAEAHAHAEMPAHHAGGSRHAPAEHHRAAECVLAMACGAAALPLSGEQSAVLPLPSAGIAWPATSAYLSPVLGSDPPPPRLA